MRALRRNAEAIHREQARRARADTRAWMMARRERTHELIELGGLVRKSGLDEALGDDRAALLGALIGLADVAKAEGGVHQVALWRRRGQRRFEADQQAQAAARALRDAPSPAARD